MAQHDRQKKAAAGGTDPLAAMTRLEPDADGAGAARKSTAAPAAGSRPPPLPKTPPPKTSRTVEKSTLDGAPREAASSPLVAPQTPPVVADTVKLRLPDPTPLSAAVARSALETDLAKQSSRAKTPSLEAAPAPPSETLADAVRDDALDGELDGRFDSDAPERRRARRRSAGPVRGRIAANDDAPSIGGLIYALEQKPSDAPFRYAMVASAVWGSAGLVFAWLSLSGSLSTGATWTQLLTNPNTFFMMAMVVVPITVIWFLALLAWRAEELRLRSSTMTEVAVRLAEPDRMAEQAIASLGQSVRRQVSFMNDAVSQSLGRAGELEALVHKEVSALERSYDENESKIRNLIQELSGERHALLNTSERVTTTLRELGTEVPELIEKLSNQQIKLAQIIQGAGDNLTQLETSLASSADKLETSIGNRTDKLQHVLEHHTATLDTALGSKTENMQGMLETYTGALGSALTNRTDQMQGMLEDYTAALATALGSRTEQMQSAFESSMQTLDSSIGNRTDTLQTVFEEYARALDTTLANRAEALDSQLIERTRALDEAFSNRLQLFDQSIQNSTKAIDLAVEEKAGALTHALEHHAKTFKETVTQQSHELDESLVHGINAVRRSSENITRQSLKAIEGLAGQSDLLKNVSENLLSQINTVTNRFENQGQSIMKAANALETANYKIDSTLQNRHQDLSSTLDRLSGKADEFGAFVSGYSTTIEGSISDAENRARAIAEDLRTGAQTHQRAAIESLEQMRSHANAESDRALADLRHRFSTVSDEVASQIGSLTSRLDETSAEVRQRAAQAAQDIANEQARLKYELDQIPTATRESTDAMRRALEDQLKALDQLSTLTNREAHNRDLASPINPPMPPGLTHHAAYGAEPSNTPRYNQAAPPQQPGQPSQRRREALSSLSETLQREMGQRMAAVGTMGAGQPTGAAGLPVPTPPAPNAANPNAANQRGPAQRGGTPSAGANQPSPWSLGDLLHRASLDEQAQQAQSGGGLNMDVIADALEPGVAGAIWQRLRAGQRNIMVRNLYSMDGRVAFDDVRAQLQTDVGMQQAVRQYFADFERIIAAAEQQDPSGQMAQSHIMDDTGRVYLFLAHAAGRIS